MIGILQPESQEKLKNRFAELNFEREVDRYNAEISERLLTELIMEIEKHRQEIEAVSKEKDELLGIAAHDLRSPLTVILGAAKLLQSQATDKTRELVQMIVRSSESMLDLLNSILDVEKIEHGRISLERQVQNLLPVLEKSLKNYSLIAQGKQIKIEYAKHADAAPALIDAIRIEEVFNNLLSNAIKYSHPDTTVTVTTGISDGRVQISVKDQGIGIQEDEVDKVFTKFAKVSNKPTAGESSTGLGLAIVKKLVELHDGEITVSSIYGKGSTFTVTLPLLKEVFETTSQKEPSPIISREAIEPMRTLLIDDSQGVRRLLAPMLKSLGLKIVGEASNGQEGLNLYEKLMPELVFLDMVMPLMSGIEVLRRIKKINPNATVVMLTSIASRESVMESKQAGAFAYLLKPFEAQKIKRVVNEIRFMATYPGKGE